MQSSPRLLYLAAILSFLKVLSAHENRSRPPARMLLEETHRAIRIFWAGRFDTNQILISIRCVSAQKWDPDEIPIPRMSTEGYVWWQRRPSPVLIHWHGAPRDPHSRPR